MNTTKKTSKKGFYAATAGAVLVALCCSTPILVITLGAVGLSAFTPYLDYVLMPALIVLIVIAAISYMRHKKDCAHCEIKAPNQIKLPVKKEIV